MTRRRLEPCADNGTIAELKQTGRVGSNETATRCTALQMLLAGVSRDQVCRALVITERSLREWVVAFNQSGIDGLIVKKRPGRTAIINADQREQFSRLIEAPAQAERDFWTAKAFHGYITDTYQVQCSYATVVRFFHQQGFALKVPQPWPDRQDEAQRQAFLKELETLYHNSAVDLWFADESGFEGDPRPRRRWDKKGKKTRATKNGDHLRMNVMGMVCPRSGELFAIEASHSDYETFQAFLNEASRSIQFKRPINILIMDNASWHKRKTTDWQGWQPKYLPPYSPDLNPIERIWLIMKARWFNNHVCRNVDQLIDRLDRALLDVINNPQSTKQTTAIGKLF